jgi:hypothetical protein
MEKGKAEIEASWGPTMRFSLEKESRNPVGETENAMAKVILTEAVTLIMLL